jgi:hypothetical protein
MYQMVPATQPAPMHYAYKVAVPKPPKFNFAAVVAIVVAVLFPPAGLGLAKSARRECRETGERGAGLALIAHVVAAAGTAMITLVVLVLASVFAFGIYQLGNGIAEIGEFLSWLRSLF